MNSAVDPDKPPPEIPLPAPQPEPPPLAPSPAEPPILDPDPQFPPPIHSRARAMSADRRYSRTAHWIIGWFVVTLALLTPRTPQAGEKSRQAPARSQRTNEVKQTSPSVVEHRTQYSLDDALKFAEKSAQALKEVKDYTALFSKAEFVKGRVVNQSMELKFREKPFSVYLHCRSKPDAGREVIYVAGANEGNLIVRDAGLKGIVGAIELAPDDPRVMEECRRPITQIGIAKILEIETALWQKDRDADPDNVEVTFFAGTKIETVECDVIEVRYRQRTPDTQFALTRIYFESETKFPIQVEHFDWSRDKDDSLPLVERYTYRDLKINVGLSESDFDPRAIGKRR